MDKSQWFALAGVVAALVMAPVANGQYWKAVSARARGNKAEAQRHANAEKSIMRALCCLLVIAVGAAYAVR